MVNGNLGTEALHRYLEAAVTAAGMAPGAATAAWCLEAAIDGTRCFAEIDSCYDFTLRELRLLDRQGVPVGRLPAMSYHGASCLTVRPEIAVVSGVEALWTSMRADVAQLLARVPCVGQ